MEAKIKAFLEDAITLSTERYDIICAIRDAFLKANLGFVEGFKYGGITYNISGELIGGIFSYKEHVSIEFGQGANFSDPNNILEGGGKHRRHIKIRVLADIEEKLVTSFIQQSA